VHGVKRDRDGYKDKETGGKNRTGNLGVKAAQGQGQGWTS